MDWKNVILSRMSVVGIQVAMLVLGVSSEHLLRSNRIKGQTFIPLQT